MSERELRTTRTLLSIALVLLAGTLVVAILGVVFYLRQPPPEHPPTGALAPDQSMPADQTPRWDSHEASADEATAVAAAVKWAKTKKGQGRPDLATQRLEQVLRDHVNATGPVIEEAHFVLAWCYMQRRDYTSAQLEFDAVKALARPGSYLYQEAESGLQWIRQRAAARAAKQPARKSGG